MDERTDPPGAPDVAAASGGATDAPDVAPASAPMAAQAPAEQPVPAPAATAARGFPGFPAGDPDQLPLSQRPRGLDATPPPGGRDPEIRATLTRERPYVRLLVGMVAVIVGGSLLLTFLALISAAFLR